MSYGLSINIRNNLCSFSIWQDLELIGGAVLHIDEVVSKDLLFKIKKYTHSNKITPIRFHQIIFAIGEGSLTALRSGYASVLGLAKAHQSEILTVSSEEYSKIQDKIQNASDNESIIAYQFFTQNIELIKYRKTLDIYNR